MNNYTQLAFHLIKTASLIDKIDSGIDVVKSLPGKIHDVVDDATDIPKVVMDAIESSKNEKLIKALLMGGAVGGIGGLGGTLLTEGDDDRNKTKHRLRNLLLGIGGGATAAGIQEYNSPHFSFS